jgi:hypothetical protein
MDEKRLELVTPPGPRAEKTTESATHREPRSIAAEVALLFLDELEPKIADDPELLVSTEAILSFAAIRRADPEKWRHWRTILTTYQKAEVIEYMLSEPARADDAEFSKADFLVRLCLRAGVELFHDPDQHGWASVRVGQHWENYPLRSRAFYLFMLRTYYVGTGESPGGQALRAALEIFEARALFDGPEHAIHLRVAEYGGKLYLDLCDIEWRAIEIDTDGWRIVDNQPPRFRRARGSQPLPEPERGGTLEELRGFFNVDSEGWALIKAFLVSALKPAMPYPILVAKGEQGAGKSTACRVISLLIDPRTSALRGAPREVRDLVAAARNSWLVCFDNLSHLPNDLADAACRLATGGGFGGRELYSDHDEAVFDATRPLVFNAIPDLGTARPDFLDRVLIVEFNDIKPERRRDERQFWLEFEKARPRILGALLDAVVLGLRNLPNVSLERLPRMADFATWATACEEGLRMGSGEFLRLYEANCIEGRDLALESSALYEPLRRLSLVGFQGTTAELLDRLNSIASERSRRSMRWPKAPNALSSSLRRLASNLRSTGIDLQFTRADDQGRRMISVHTTAESPKRSSVIVSDSQ